MQLWASKEKINIDIIIGIIVAVTVIVIVVIVFIIIVIIAIIIISVILKHVCSIGDRTSVSAPHFSHPLVTRRLHR